MEGVRRIDAQSLWTDKASAEGKTFTRLARTFFPKTIAFAKELPFTHIGRCNVMGLEANDHGTVHRDGDPDDQAAPDHFITLCPAGDKRLYLLGRRDEDEDTRRRSARIGFNDHDYHGVDADPFFRYSIRVDGVFRPDFLELLRRESSRLMGDEDIGGFTQKETIDKPGIIGARWWQESIANEVPRRKAIQTMMLFGGALTVIAGVGWLASKASKGSGSSIDLRLREHRARR